MPASDPPPPVTDAEIRRRQRSRSLATGLILGFLVVLFFAIGIVRMG